MTVFDRIEQLREEAAKIAKAKNEAQERCDALPESDLAGSIELFRTADQLRNRLVQLEAEITNLILARLACPDCPYPPCRGKLEKTAQAHVLRCDRCGATTLPGRGESRAIGEVLVGEFGHLAIPRSAVVDEKQLEAVETVLDAVSKKTRDTAAAIELEIERACVCSFPADIAKLTGKVPGRHHLIKCPLFSDVAKKGDQP